MEKKDIGGAGIWNGALSSKTWWEISREHANARKTMGQIGVNIPHPAFQVLKDQVQKATVERAGLLVNHLDKMDTQLMCFVEGSAFVDTPHQVSVTYPDGKIERFEVAHIILATGSRPRALPEIPIDHETILTSDDIDRLKDYPKSMVILGAGVIGCEFATIFSNLGQTEVRLIDKGDRILPFEDEDVVKIIEDNLEKQKVIIHRNSQLVSMKRVGGMVEYELLYDDGHRETHLVEKALISVGRIPNYENLWSEEHVPIARDSRGFIDDQDTQTSVPNIYAVGDITADIALVNIGELEGRYAVERMYGKPQKPMLYENISTIMFLNPEVAGVGMNETQARQAGVPYKVVTLDYSCISRAIAMRNTQGFVKVLVSHDEEMRILGMRVVGEHASSAIQAVALLISMGKGIEELAELIHPHPSITEGIQECVRMLLGKSMLKPQVLRQVMTCKSCCEGVYEDIVF